MNFNLTYPDQTERTRMTSLPMGRTLEASLARNLELTGLPGEAAQLVSRFPLI